jgi:hypothetical protein
MNVLRAWLRRRRSLPAVGLMIAVGLPLSGCIGLFEPAVPQPPETSGNVNIVRDYRDPISTLGTMAAGIAAKGLGNGKAAYVGAFADSTVDGVPFYATFDPAVAARYPTVPTWNLGLESNFYSDFVGLRSDGYTMRWTEASAPGDEIDLLNGEAEIYRRYEVFTVAEDGSTLGRIAVGIAHLFYKRFGSRWAIVRWEDQVDPNVGVEPADPDELSLSARRLGS